MRRFAAEVHAVLRLRIEDCARRVSAGLNLFHRALQEAAHLDDEGVAGAEMLDAAVDHRSHAFGGAGVLVQELRDAAEVDVFLHGPVLQIVVALVAQLFIVSVDEVTFR